MSIGIIAGSGIDFLVPDHEWSEVMTPYGQAYLCSADIAGKEFVLLRRHGPALNIPPHLINYRANIAALQKVGVRQILATAAVGSLQKDILPGTLAVLDDFIDFTKQRKASIYDSPSECVMHVDFTVPYCPEISSAMVRAASSLDIPMRTGMTYLCVDGPRYETPAEVRMFSRWGGDVVGMTGVPEVIIARELGICYGSLAIVANYGTGILDKPLSHMDVLRAIGEQKEKVYRIIEAALVSIDEEHTCVK